MTEAEDERGDRPSMHGQIAGKALAALVEAGGGEQSDCCMTCAFRIGAMPNLMAGTAMVALNCAIGVDDSPFGCHHGMKDGTPTKLCAGYVAAMRAPYEEMRAIVTGVVKSLDQMEGPDTVRAAFDEWVAETDPDGKLDVYQQGRLFARAFANPPSQENSRG